MKKLNFIRIEIVSGALVVFALGFLAGNLSAPVLAPVQAQLVPAGNGDVNGDGTIDISDPVGLVSYLFLGGEPPIPIPQIPLQDRTVLLVRHAEKGTGTDPDLTPEGQIRADHLKTTLERAEIGAVLATNYRRTVETVKPAADARSLEVETFDQIPDLIAALRALPSRTTALLAGNSFNIPDIASGLGVEEAVAVNDEYDNLWVIRYGGSAGAGASMVHLRYWQP